MIGFTFKDWILHLIVIFTFWGRYLQSRNGKPMARKNITGVFVLLMAMIFIFGFAKFYLLEEKLEHFENPKIFSENFSISTFFRFQIFENFENKYTNNI